MEDKKPQITESLLAVIEQYKDGVIEIDLVKQMISSSLNLLEASVIYKNIK